MSVQELAVAVVSPTALDWIEAARPAREAYWHAVHGDEELAAWLAEFTPTHL